MRNIYEKPSFELTNMEVEDVILSSGVIGEADSGRVDVSRDWADIF